MDANNLVRLQRAVTATIIPDGDKTELPKDLMVRILQEMGGSFTVLVPTGARFRIEGNDADSLGKEVPEEAKNDFSDDTPDDRSFNTVKTRVWDQLRKVHDPEIPFNIVEVGLIYECDIENMPGSKDTYRVRVLMTLTAPGCGMGDVLVEDVRRVVAEVPGVERVDVELTFDPAWDFSMLSESARLALNL